MATIKMRKGDKYADVYDSPETIRQAQLDGYSVVEKQKTAEKAVAKEENTETVKQTRAVKR